MLPISQEDDRVIDLKPWFSVPESPENARTISQRVAYLLSQTSDELPKASEMLEKVNQDLQRSLDLAFNKQDSQELLEVHKTLFQIYETSLGHPLSNICSHEHSPWLIQIRSQIETAWLESELSRLQDLPDEGTTRDPMLLCEWLKKEAAKESEVDQQVVNFLRQEATKEQFNTFVVSDAILNYRFCDALALAQVHFSEVVKAEIVSNMWDEIGCGIPERFHSREFSTMLKFLNLKITDTSVWGEYWQPYCGHNLYFLFGLNRQHFFKSIGSLSMPELFDPHRDRAIVAGLNRLYPGGVNHNFYSHHIETDLKHGQNWLDNVITPIVKIHPKAGRELAIGGALRMEAMRRYNQYLSLRCLVSDNSEKGEKAELDRGKAI